MIPAPPHDPALPGLPTALDGEAMCALLGAHATRGAELVGCLPVYVRYKPGTSCLVQYRVAFAGEPAEALAHVKLFAGERARKLWAKGTLQRLAASAPEGERGSGLEPAAHLPELAAVLHAFPVDPALPALVFAASPSGSRRVLRQIGADDRTGTVELVRYKPGRKALLRYGTNGGAAYAKLYEGERGRLVLAAGRALGAAGVLTATPLAYLASLRMLVHAEAEGRPLRSLGGEAFAAGAGAAGEALGVLHAAPVPDLPWRSWADEAAELAAAARAVAAVRPDLGEEAARLAADVTGLLSELPDGAAPTHGDFSDDQVLVADGGAVLLDLDEIHTGHPWRDVANFLAHLSLRGDAAARAAFLAGYGLGDAAELAPLEAGALLKLAVAPFRRLESDWPSGLEARLALARSRLPARAPGRPLDAALPQLAALTDPALVAAALEGEGLGEVVRVREATVIRHKPGRRGALRYEVQLRPGGRVERLYGKTYASDRGPRVFRTLQALHGALGGQDAVAVPEPVAFLPGLRLLLQREVRGTPVRDALLAGDEQLAARVAEAVAALHRAPVTLARAHSLADELRVLRGRVADLEAHRGRAHACLARVERAADAPWSWRALPVHRDLYHDQVLVDGDRVALVDLDDAAVSEPAIDVANFLAHLRLLALEEPQRRDGVARAAAAFRARAAELDPLLDAQLVRVLEAATLLRLATIHGALKPRLLRECEALCPPEPPAAPRVRSGSRVARALDGDWILQLVGEAVEKRTGARPTACRSRLLRRHKGRAVVRYTFDTPRGELALVGKWFRAGRSARVVEVHEALRAHGLAGELAVPDVVAHEPELRAVFFEAAAGPSLRDVLDDDPEQARRAGAWLGRFHGCGATLPPRRSRPAPRAWPPPLAALAAELGPALRSLEPGPELPTHWDFASVEVLVPPAGPTVVTDFDDAALDDPALDVANFEATLALRGLRRYGSPDAYASAVAAFRRGYEEERGALPPVAPAVESFVWLRLARRNLRTRPDGIVWPYAFARAEAALGQQVGA